MTSSSRVIFFMCSILLLLTFGTSLSAAEQLNIRLLPPTESERLMGQKSWRLYLNGSIGESDHIRVQREVEKIAGNHFRVFLNSTGGDLFAGLELGRLFRSRGAWTYIGRENNGDFPEIPLPGKCYSACALAFLGGFYRFDGGDIGVHRAWKETINPTDFDAGQVISSRVTAYIRDMGVDIRLQEKAMKKGKNQIYILSKSEKEELHVVNNGRGKAEWKLDFVSGDVVLIVHQPSMYGDGWLFLSCTQTRTMLISSYEAGETAANDIASGNWVHHLLLDGEEYPIGQPGAKIADGNKIRSFFGVSKRDIVALLSAKDSIGHSIKNRPDAPFFYGYTINLDQDSKRMLHSYIANCASSGA